MILYRYIIKEHILPFLYSLGIITFIFIMTTAVQLLDKIISKGLALPVVLEIFAINLGWIIALAIPMSILTATLMTFGKMSADNEILAIKATGQNLTFLITPVFLVAAILAVVNVYFNDLILPDANHRAANLLSDISRKRPAVLLEPGVLIRDFPGYALWVKKVNPVSGSMKMVRIYSDAAGEDPMTTVATTGDITMTRDEKQLKLTLYDGETHSVNTNAKEYFLGRFKKQVVFLENPDTELRRTNSDFRSDREMDIAMMQDEVAGIRTTRNSYLNEYNLQMESLKKHIIALDSQATSAFPQGTILHNIDTVRTFASWASQFIPVSHTDAVQEMERNKNITDNVISRVKFQDMMINQYLVEVQKKYALPFACIVFVLIGAPLGIMARRGGIAVGASYSIFFFIIYWALLIGGENLGDKCIISPVLAMWSGNILIGICGLFLIMSMKRETSIISFSWIPRLWGHLIHKPSQMLKASTRRSATPLHTLVTLPFYPLRPVVSILSAYLIRKFIGYLAGFLIAITVIFIVGDYFSNLQRFEHASLSSIALYYWYYMPWLIQVISPIVILLATMSAIGAMTRWNELVAMKASGMNVRQLTAPLLVIGVVLAVGGFMLSEHVLPKANMLRRELSTNLGMQKALKKAGKLPPSRDNKNDFYYFGSDRHLYFYKAFRPGDAQGYGVWREAYTPSSIVEKIFADNTVYKNGSWYFIHGMVRIFTKDHESAYTFDTLQDTVLKESPLDMVAQIKSPEEMSYWELKNYTDKTRRRGEDVSKYDAQLQFKLAYPVMNFIVIILGLSISARAGKKGSAVLFGIGLLLIVAYWIISQFGLAFAQNGQISAVAGAWFGNVVFLIIALILYSRASR